MNGKSATTRPGFEPGNIPTLAECSTFCFIDSGCSTDCTTGPLRTTPVNCVTLVYYSLLQKVFTAEHRPTQPRFVFPHHNVSLYLVRENINGTNYNRSGKGAMVCRPGIKPGALPTLAEHAQPTELPASHNAQHKPIPLQYKHTLCNLIDGGGPLPCDRRHDGRHMWSRR